MTHSKEKKNKLTNIITGEDQTLHWLIQDPKSTIQIDRKMITPTKIGLYAVIIDRQELWDFLSKWQIEAIKFCIILTKKCQPSPAHTQKCLSYQLTYLKISN